MLSYFRSIIRLMTISREYGITHSMSRMGIHGEDFILIILPSNLPMIPPPDVVRKDDGFRKLICPCCKLYYEEDEHGKRD